jgi:ATP-dependent Clp protease adaptor protein ClpS
VWLIDVGHTIQEVNMSTDVETIERQETKLKRPKKWAVILHNDDVTPMDFVIELLYYVFKMDLETATHLMLQVHTEGQGVAGIYPYEIAEQKYTEAKTMVRLSNQQLKLTLEEE